MSPKRTVQLCVVCILPIGLNSLQQTTQTQWVIHFHVGKVNSMPLELQVTDYALLSFFFLGGGASDIRHKRNGNVTELFLVIDPNTVTLFVIKTS